MDDNFFGRRIPGGFKIFIQSFKQCIGECRALLFLRHGYCGFFRCSHLIYFCIEGIADTVKHQKRLYGDDDIVAAVFCF